jgi:DNA polymerase I-like protein with 3'-5' exonuclease and polymerase domains
LVLDFETTNIEKGSALNADNRIVLACWQDQYGIMSHWWGGELDQHELVAKCNEADFLVAHNAKFELQWLERCGYDIGSRPVYCTMVGEWVLAGNRAWGRMASLNDCLERRGLGTKDDTVSLMIKSGVCPSDIPRSLLLKYGRRDVYLTHQLFDSQLREMWGTRLLPVVYTRCITIAPLADIETNGLHLDAERVEEEYNETLGRFAVVMESLNEIATGVNPKSPPQVAHFVYGDLGFKERCDKKGVPIRNKPTKQFPDGMPKTDEATLLSLGAKTERQKEFLVLKKKQAHLSSALDKNLSMFVGACREKDSMIYATLNQCITITHRLASAGRSTYYKMFDKFKGCQFQNLPRIYKKLFSSRRPDWLIAEADYTQLEFGVAGHVGDDDVIRHEVKEGYDVHSFTRDTINAVDKRVIDRTGAKRHTFKPLYGGQSGTKGEKAYYQAFGEKYHALKDTQDGWCIEVEATKVLETEWGMRFYWPHAKYSHDGWLNVKTNVYNTAIQSFATADIVPIGLTHMWHRTREAEMLLVNTVHDSVEAEFPENERELYEEVVVQSLVDDVYSYLDRVYDVQFSVPLGVEMTIGRHWGETLEGESEIKIQPELPQLKRKTI